MTVAHSDDDGVGDAAAGTPPPLSPSPGFFERAVVSAQIAVIPTTAENCRRLGCCCSVSRRAPGSALHRCQPTACGGRSFDSRSRRHCQTVTGARPVCLAWGALRTVCAKLSFPAASDLFRFSFFLFFFDVSGQLRVITPAVNFFFLRARVKF